MRYLSFMSVMERESLSTNSAARHSALAFFGCVRRISRQVRHQRPDALECRMDLIREHGKWVEREENEPSCAP